MSRRMMFADRSEAGRLLADRVAALSLGHAIVLALPRGGVPVGAEIARRLGVPLDVAHVRKIGAPGQPELAIGAIADGDDPEVVVNGALVRELGLSEDFVAAQAAREQATIAQRRSSYARLRPPIEPQGRAVVVVDDGVATGMTMRAALRHVKRRGPSRLVAAVPVASRDALSLLRAEADAVVCLASPRRFGAVGAFYRSFTQVTDQEVTELLRQPWVEGRT
jgi:putative phosphoribosyl transferase